MVSALKILYTTTAGAPPEANEVYILEDQVFM